MIKSTPNQIPNNPQHPNQSAKPADLPEDAFPQYEAHPAAEIFPEMDAKTLDDLAVDIKTNKQHMPIILFEGKILDGRSRYLACKKASVSPKTKEITPGEFAAMHGHAPVWGYRMLYKGRIKAIRGAGRLRIPRDEVERFDRELVFHDGGTSK